MKNGVVDAWQALSKELPGFEFGNVKLIDPDCSAYPEMLVAFRNDLMGTVSATIEHFWREIVHYINGNTVAQRR